MYQPELSADVGILPDFPNVCPFADNGSDEYEIGTELFSNDCSYDSKIGYYNKLFIGNVEEDDYRKIGSGGGIITWLLAELIKTGKIDFIIHVKNNNDSKKRILFKYDISKTIEDVKDGAKSRYYPIEMSEVLEKIRATPGRYAIVGLPCFIKAIRKLGKVDPIIKERVTFLIGLVCGHLKSNAFADYFGWQVGIPPGKLEEIDFRKKFSDLPARHYGLYLKGAGKEVTRPVREFIGANWGHNLFRYPACDFCDDVFAETADIVVGDAWLPDYEKDPRGTSIVVLRNRELGTLIENGIIEGRLMLCNTNTNEITKSQAGGLRDRREGLAYRLWLKQKASIWFPKKRVLPNRSHLTIKRRWLYRIRSNIGQESHRAWFTASESGRIEDFNITIMRLVNIYNWSYFTINQRINYITKEFIKKIINTLKGNE
jgi:coenzyme F420 hydrogenase subunit beta